MLLQSFPKSRFLKAVPALDIRRNFFRVALPVTLRSLNFLARGLPGSFRYNDEIHFWDLYPIFVPWESCSVFLEGGRVKRGTTCPQIDSFCKEHSATWSMIR